MDQDSRQASMGDDETSPGRILAAARFKLGLSIADVADAICLSKTTVSDLENDHHRHMPAPVFTRGYLLAYARVVNVSSTVVLPALDRFKSQSIELTQKVEPPTIPLSEQIAAFSKKHSVTLGSALIALMVLFFFIHGLHFSSASKVNTVVVNSDHSRAVDKEATFTLQATEKNVTPEQENTASQAAESKLLDLQLQAPVLPAHAAAKHQQSVHQPAASVTTTQTPVSVSLPLKPTYTVTPVKHGYKA